MKTHDVCGPFQLMLASKGKDPLGHTFVVCNDRFTNGQDVTVQWNAESHDPLNGNTDPLASGTFTIPVPYGEKREQLVKFDLPQKLTAGRRLHNPGGGASEHWTLEAPLGKSHPSSPAQPSQGRQQNLHFQIDPTTAGTGTVSRKIKIKGASGYETSLTVTCRHRNHTHPVHHL